MTEAKYTREQLAAWQKEASESLTTYATLAPLRVAAPAIEFTEDDCNMVIDAYKTCQERRGTWLRLDVPTTIPVPIAQQLLSDRLDVLTAAAKSQTVDFGDGTMVPLTVRTKSNKEGDSSHSRYFKVNPVAPRGTRTAK